MNKALASRLDIFNCASQALGRPMPCAVIRPENYTERQADWPVLYLLHGRGRSERSLIDLPAAVPALLAAPFFIVLPRGEDGWYIDSPVRPADRYASYLEDVMAAVERMYGVSRRPEGRAIAGWSMGGYGAVRFAENHARQFAAAASIIGLLDFPGAASAYEVPVDRFGNDPAVWAQFNPGTHAECLRGTAVLLVAADQAFDRTMNETFARRLREMGIACQWRLLNGAHTIEVVCSALPMLIDFCQSILRPAGKLGAEHHNS